MSAYHVTIDYIVCMPYHVIIHDHDSGDISELKIACLDAMRKEAKRRYQESIDIYVREYMGRPLDKIHVRWR